MYWNTEMGGWGYLLMAVTMLLFWGTLIAAIVLFARSLSGQRPSGPEDHHGLPGAAFPTAVVRPAEGILAERFARGEISAEEYKQSLSVLRGRPQT
ncbi:SHOCT domain-containing protein [Paenarthrobacter sp. NPDC092416]|uniref:SHOCT domain-containing protein n=1 Tax=Paenarthrobacter sp. NPDC092416 TaxID=3364386 RepID=UPI00381E4501